MGGWSGREADQTAGGQGLDLMALGRAIWAKRLWIAVPTLAALVGTFGVVSVTQPTYRSETRLIVESGENPYTRSEVDRSNGGDRAAVDQEAVLSQVQLVLSRDVAQAVATQLELARRPEFDPTLRGFNPVKQVLILIGLMDDPLRMTAEERVLKSYYEKLTAFQVDKSRVIAIQFDSTDPLFAAEAANVVAARFLEAQQASKRSQTRNASEWLAGEVEQLRRKVQDSEGRVESFRARSNLFVGSNNTSLTGQQLAEVNSQIAAARAQQSDAQTRSRLLRDFLRAGRPIESGDVVNSEIIRRLNEQRAAVQAQLAEQSSTLGPRHPRIAELRAQATNLDSQLRSEAEKMVRVLENDARLAGARVEALSQNLDQAKRQSSDASEQEVQLRVLEREAKSHRDQLEALLARYRDATARDSLNALPADARIVSRATVSNVPAFPKKVPTMLIVTLGTFLLALGTVATLALLASPDGAERHERNEPNFDEAGAESEAHQPVMLVSGPDLSPESLNDAEPALRESIGHDSDRATDGPTAGSFDELLTLLNSGTAEKRRTLVVGTEADLVATGVCLAFARELAGSGSKVVMIDCAANGALSALAGPGAAGLADFADGRADLPAIIHRDPASRAHIVPAGNGEPDAEAREFAVSVLAGTYDALLILGDRLPSDAAAFEALAALAGDAVIVSASDARDPKVVSAYRRLDAVGLKPVVVMLAEANEAPLAEVVAA